MRILICMSHANPGPRHMIAMLQSLGNEVHVFDFAGDLPKAYLTSKIPGVVSDFALFRSQVAGIHLAAPPAKGNLRYVLYAREFRRLTNSLGIDLVLSLYGGGFALMTYLSGFRPYSVFVVGSDVLLANRLTRLINRRTMTCASEVFANGEYLAARAREQAPHARIRPLLIGVDTSRFHRATPPSGPVRFICTRGNQETYNNGSIVRALSRLPEDVPDFRLVFTAGGSLLSQTVALAQRLLTPTMRRRVEFWGGVSHARILEGLHGSHSFISMSRSDGTSSSLLEALACGLYPILSDIPQNREWICPDKANGILVPLDDDYALAGALLSVLHNPGRCARASEFNRTQVQERGDADKKSRELACALERIVAGPEP